MFKTVKTGMTLSIAARLVAFAAPALAGHHKAGEVHYKSKSAEDVRVEKQAEADRKALIEARAPVAKPGKIIVVYKNKCAKFAQQDALRSLDALIQHERANAPVTYSSSPLVFEDGDMGAIDTHVSIAKYKEAVAWQNSDAVWQGYFTEILTSCGITADDISVTVSQVQ